MTKIVADALEGGDAKRLYEDLSIIHAALGEDWQARLVEILRTARLPEARPVFNRWEADHGYRRR